MEWGKLVNGERMRHSTQLPEDSRSPFESDYDRIIYCSAFRRLQDKAQVFSLEKQDYVRTRLTHTLEVASLGRSFGKDIGDKLAKKNVKFFLSNDSVKFDIAAIISSACLIHDVGNPPFGHFGEYAIQNWFEKWFKKNDFYLKQMKDKEILDFLKFEGNAQSFRILTKLQYLIDGNGLNLTFAVLSTLLKYPRISTEVYKLENSKAEPLYSKTKLKNMVSYKKHGCFQSEVDTFKKVKEKVGIKDFRHPLAFLVESADDIANSAADVEDAFKKKAIDYSKIYSSFKKALGNKHDIVKNMNRYYRESKVQKYPEPEASVIQRLRALLQGRMFRSCISVFLQNYESIIEGEYDCDLISQANDDSQLMYNTLMDLACDNVYCNNNVISLELVGLKVINELLDIFVPAILSEQCNEIKSEMGKYFNLISPNFRFVMNNYTEETLYNKLQLATDFICGMTDSFALDLYQKLTGYRIN